MVTLATSNIRTMTLTFLALTAFFTGAFLVAADFALAAGLLLVIAYPFKIREPIASISFTSRTFFAAPRLDGTVVFLVVVDFALPAKAFLGAAAVFLTGGGAAAFLVVVVLALESGLEFCREIKMRYHMINEINCLTSFEADVKGLALEASLTLPDGPLGSRKMPSSVPLVMARFS